MRKTQTQWLESMKKGSSPLWDVVLLNLLVLLMMMLPFAHYRYKKADYTLSGLQFLTGTTIQDGSVTVKANWMIIGIVLLTVVCILAAILFPKMKKKHTGGFLICISAFVQIILYSLFA